MDDIEIIREISSVLGYPDQFTRETREPCPDYLEACLKLFESNPDKNLRNLAAIYKTFSETCESRQLRIRKDTDKYLKVAFAILLNEDYELLLRQFVVDRLKELFRNSQNLIPDDRTKRTRIDFALEQFQKCVTFEKANRKSLVEYVRSLHYDGAVHTSQVCGFYKIYAGPKPSGHPTGDLLIVEIEPRELMLAATHSDRRYDWWGQGKMGGNIYCGTYEHFHEDTKGFWRGKHEMHFRQNRLTGKWHDVSGGQDKLTWVKSRQDKEDINGAYRIIDNEEKTKGTVFVFKEKDRDYRLLAVQPDVNPEYREWMGEGQFDGKTYIGKARYASGLQGEHKLSLESNGSLKGIFKTNRDKAEIKWVPLNSTLAIDYLNKLTKLWPAGKNPESVIDLIRKQIEECSDFFVPLAFDILYFWDEPDKCAQHALTISLDICREQFKKDLDDLKKSETSPIVESYVIVVCPENDCKQKLRISYPCKEGIYKCKKCGRKFQYVQGSFWDTPLPQKPDDAPDDVRKEAKKLLEKVLNICAHYLEGRVLIIETKEEREEDKRRRDNALKGIAECAAIKTDGRLRLQVSVTDSKQTCLYHIEEDIIGKRFAADLDISGEEGEFIHSTRRPERETLWQYRKLDYWNWYIFVEGHLYPKKIDNFYLGYEFASNGIVKACHNLLLEIQRRLNYDIQYSITDRFKYQVVQILRHYLSGRLTSTHRIWAVGLIWKLFSEQLEEEIIFVLWRVATIDDLPDERWSQTLFDVCTGSNPKATTTRYLFDLLKVNLLAPELSKENIAPLLEVCRDNFFNIKEMDTLINELLCQDIGLDRIKVVASLFPIKSPQFRLFNEFKNYQPRHDSEFNARHRLLSMRLLLSSSYKDNNELRYDIQNRIRELFRFDVTRDPKCDEERALNNFRVMKKVIHELPWNEGGEE